MGDPLFFSFQRQCFVLLPYEMIYCISNPSTIQYKIKSKCCFASRQSQIGKLGRDSLSPQEIAALQDSICSLAASQRQSITDESLDADSVSQLLSQHAEALLGEKSEAESSQSKM